MTTPTFVSNPHPHHREHLSFAVAGLALAMTLVFHFILMASSSSLAFALFELAVIAGIHAVSLLTRQPGNKWAYALLLPAALCIVAQIMYANPVVMNFAPLVAYASLLLFSYWYFVPKVECADVQQLLPREIFAEAVIPIEGASGIFSFVPGRRKQGVSIAIGLLLSLPLLVIFTGLFAAADPVFDKALSGFFDRFSWAGYWRELVRNLIVFAFFLRAGWAMLTRRLANRHPKPKSIGGEADGVLTTTVLAVLNALFIVFVGFQLFYFFGDPASLSSQNFKYADYAREGYFQLLWAAGLVFMISAIVYRWTLKHWASRNLTIALLVETLVILASASKRLWLYTDAYGLTASRWWAWAGIFVIGGFLIGTALAAQRRAGYPVFERTAILAVLLALSGLFTFNFESDVARVNIDRFLRDGHRIDLIYLNSLSSDAVPELKRLAESDWGDRAVAERLCAAGQDQRECLVRALEGRRQDISDLMSRNWLNFSVSKMRALVLIAK